MRRRRTPIQFGILCVRVPPKNIHLFKRKSNVRVFVSKQVTIVSNEKKKKKEAKNLLHANQNWNSSGGVRLSFSGWPQNESAGFVRACSGRRDYIIILLHVENYRVRPTTEHSSHIANPTI